MLQQKVYVRAHRGKVAKVVREHYLRTDIACGVATCGRCEQYVDAGVLPSLSDGPILVPDTNVFIRCIDLFESDLAFYHVIVLQVVLEELKARSLPLFNRLKAILQNGNKRFYVFHNEFLAQTFVQRLSGESMNDRNDRAIRTACKWYLTHGLTSTSGASSGILLLTDDRDNRKKALEDGIPTASVQDYLRDIPNGELLLEMIASLDDGSTLGAEHRKCHFPEYYSQSQLLLGVKSGNLHQGVFSRNPYNFLEGTVANSTASQKTLIVGLENTNRAVHGDVVVYQMLPECEWRCESGVIVEEEKAEANENPEGDDNENNATEHGIMQIDSPVAQAQPTGKIVGIIKRNWRMYVGQIDPSSFTIKVKGDSLQSVLFLPMDRRIPRIRIRTRQAPSLVNQRIVVVIDSWDRFSRFPSGHFLRRLGQIEGQEAETEAILLEYNVAYLPFPKTVLDCLPTEGHDWRVPSDLKDSAWTNRRDLRQLLVCSIDPPGCQDIDDALHARKLPNGNIEAGVHIADVSHFVKPNTAMDIEAAARGTTVYMVDKRIDMLPSLLGTDLCSLVANAERLAFSVIWELTPDGHIVSIDCCKSVIRSRQSFSYDEAQVRIDDRKQQDEITNSMRLLLQLSKHLRAARMEAGALNLASPEVKIELESETSDPVDIQSKELRETNSLVEEFMLLANISVARKIYASFSDTAMLRRHGDPPPSNFEVLQTMLRVRKGLSLRVDTSKALAESLDECVVPNEPFFNVLVRILATRCMLSAEYFACGSFPPSEFRHYGLASDIYTHFTSPIRRYADIIVHRQLATAIGYETAVHPTLRDRSGLEKICERINARHRNAQMAARASIEYYVGRALKIKGASEEDAFVIKVFKNGFVVFVARFGIEGLIHARDIGGSETNTEFEPSEYKLRVGSIAGGKGHLQIAVFDQVRVKVESTRDKTTLKPKIKLTLISPTME